MAIMFINAYEKCSLKEESKQVLEWQNLWGRTHKKEENGMKCTHPKYNSKAHKDQVQHNQSYNSRGERKCNHVGALFSMDD